jgi:exodeoxyribonuclease-3
VKIATWNVNSLNIRLPHLLQWLEANPVDVLCIQETKLTDDKFPLAAINAAGYQVAYSGQKTYNGVAILSRHPIEDVVKGNPRFVDEQQRLIAATIQGMRFICAYVPNGQAVGSDKYLYKMAWLTALREWVEEELRRHAEPGLALLGDYNIAPQDRDVHDPALWEGQIHFSQPEKDHFAALLELGLVDAFRLFEQPDKTFSWWDYRQLAFQKNRGLRIDHILLTPALAKRCGACMIDRATRKWPQPSDHAPVVATLD